MGFKKLYLLKPTSFDPIDLLLQNWFSAWFPEISDEEVTSPSKTSWRAQEKDTGNWLKSLILHHSLCFPTQSYWLEYLLHHWQPPWVWPRSSSTACDPEHCLHCPWQCLLGLGQGTEGRHHLWGRWRLVWHVQNLIILQQFLLWTENDDPINHLQQLTSDCWSH